MTKKALIASIAEKTGMKKPTIATIIQQVFETMKQSIAHEKRFTYVGFGSFLVHQRKARNGCNPKTGEKIRIKASKNVGFRVASAFKEAL